MKVNYVSIVDANRLLKKLKDLSFTSFLVILIMVLSSAKGNAETYPFTGLPDTIVATLNIETSQTEPYINTLLGYNISRFTTAAEKDIIKKFDPITIRFPMGIFSNWYDWRTDDFTYYSPWTDEDHQPVVDGQSKAGIGGLEVLNNDKAETNNVGYDFLMTWNMSYDGYKGNDDTTNTESIARLQHYKDMGFDVTGIEFGNELFYRTQRSPYIPNEAGFLARAKKLSKDLKSVVPDVKISIPLIFRNSATNPNWNKLIAADASYFDAISVHKYIGVDVDNRLDLSSIGFEFGLTARLSLEPAVTFARKYAQDKPVWLTEWGVDVGTSPTGNAASCLGMADCYIYMSENQDIYQRANWFSANSSANQLIKLETGTFSTIQYPLLKTGYGFTYDIIRSVFENSTLLNSTVSTSSKLALIGSSVDAVSARVVVKDGKTLILALNLTDKPAELHLNKDGSILEDGYKMQSVKFNGIDDLPLIPWYDNPFNFSQEGSSTVMLPPLSINKITLNGPVEYAVNFETPEDREEIDLGTNLVVEATAGSKVTGVSLFLNDELVRNITSAPYKWGVDSILKNLNVGFYDLKLVATNADTISFSDLISIEIVDTVKQYPYKDTIQIPGTIEAEDYDLGGEGLSFHDADEVNKGGVYRTDAVDIGEFSAGLYNIGWTANGEWLEYTVNIAEAAAYDVEIHYSAGRTAPAKIGLEMPEEGTVLFNNFTLPLTANWDTYDSISQEEVLLPEGRHVLRLNINISGCNIDKLVFSKTPVSAINEVERTVIKVYPNPSVSGQFHLSEYQEWEVYSIDGLKVLEGRGTTVDISSFSKGFFLLKTEIGVERLLYK